MSKFRIVTDGSCDLPQDWCRAHQISVIPLYFSISSAIPEAYPGGRAFPLSEFYTMLRKGTPMHTSAPSIEDCKDILRPLLTEGFDLVYTGLSSQLSGVFNVMRLAAMELSEDFPERRIAVLDSAGGSLGLGMLLRRMAAAREQGESYEAVCTLCENERRRIGCWFTVSDLMFLKRGGRISGGAAVMGTVLQIMPMLRVTPEGAITPYSKVRGRKSALRVLADELGNAAEPGTAVVIGHCDAQEDAVFVRDILRRKYGIREVQIGEIGPVLGVHAGPDAIAGFCIKKG